MGDVLEVIPPPMMDPAELVKDTLRRVCDGDLSAQVRERFLWQFRRGVVRWWAANYEGGAGLDIGPDPGPGSHDEMALIGADQRGEKYADELHDDVVEWVKRFVGPHAMVADSSEPVTLDFERVRVQRVTGEDCWVWVKMSERGGYRISGFSTSEDVSVPIFP